MSVVLIVTIWSLLQSLHGHLAGTEGFVGNRKESLLERFDEFMSLDRTMSNAQYYGWMRRVSTARKGE